MSVTKRQRVLLGDVQPTLRLDWPTGRPASAPAVKVYHPSYEADDTSVNPVASGTATLSSVNTTTTAIVASGATSIPITTRTGIAVDDRLWLVAADGWQEWCEVAGVTAGSGTTGTLTVKHPVSRAFASGAAVQSAICTYQLPVALDTTYWADEDEYVDNWRARWAVGAMVEWTYFDFGLRAESYNFDLRDLRKLAADLFGSEAAPDAGLRMRPYSEAAVERIRVDLRLRQIDPDRVMGADEMRELWRMLTLSLAAYDGVVHRGRDPEKVAAYYRAQYEALLRDTAATFRGYDATQTGVSGTRSAPILLRARRY